MLGGEARDDGARLLLFGKGLQGAAHPTDECFVSVLEREAQLGRGVQPGVGAARIIERPFDELVHEVALEIGELRAFGARQHHHDGRAVCQAVVEQVAGERVIRRVGLELAHVLCVTEGSHTCARATAQLRHQLGRHRGAEELLLAGKVLVQVADRRAGASRHAGHGGGGIALLGKGTGRGGHEGVAHVRLGHLDHLKENHTFSFKKNKARPGADAKPGYRRPTKANASRPSVSESGFLALIVIHSFMSLPCPGSK